jgi:amino acid transporter
LVLVTVVQVLLGLIILGSSSAFLAFVSVGVIALAVSYAIPIGTSMWYGREEVVKARWKLPPGVGWVVNSIAIAWIAFECVLFSMPTALPVTEVIMNYASVVLVGFMALAGLWYLVHARKGMFNSCIPVTHMLIVLQYTKGLPPPMVLLHDAKVVKLGLRAGNSDH